MAADVSIVGQCCKTVTTYVNEPLTFLPSSKNLIFRKTMHCPASVVRGSTAEESSRFPATNNGAQLGARARAQLCQRSCVVMAPASAFSNLNFDGYARKF